MGHKDEEEGRPHIEKTKDVTGAFVVTSDGTFCDSIAVIPTELSHDYWTHPSQDDDGPCEAS
jgi:hypothetical protein